MTDAPRNYPDLPEHMEALEQRGLLRRIDRPIDKDAEMHPLVRWQFVGGIDQAERKAFLFTNITDGLGRKYDIPVVVGAIAANPDIYSVGMQAPLSDIQAKWDSAIANPVEPRLVNEAVCHEVVIEGDALKGEGQGLDRLPIPISTPGFDSAPTLTATNVITRDPDTGVQKTGAPPAPRFRQPAAAARAQRDRARPGPRRAEQGPLPRRIEGAGSPGGAHVLHAG